MATGKKSLKTTGPPFSAKRSLIFAVRRYERSLSSNAISFVLNTQRDTRRCARLHRVLRVTALCRPRRLKVATYRCAAAITRRRAYFIGKREKACARSRSGICISVGAAASEFDLHNRKIAFNVSGVSDDEGETRGTRSAREGRFRGIIGRGFPPSVYNVGSVWSRSDV